MPMKTNLFRAFATLVCTLLLSLTATVSAQAVPESGKAYTITTRADRPLYIIDNDGVLTTTETLPSSRSGWWLCTVKDGHFYLQNCATSRYFGWRQTQDAPYYYDIAESQNYSGYVTLWSNVTNGSLGSRYVWVSTTEGTTTTAFNYGTGVNTSMSGWTSEFLFTEVSSSMNVLTIKTVPQIETTFKWNGHTKMGSQVSFFVAEDEEVTDESITTTFTGNDIYEAGSFTPTDSWDGKSNLEVIYAAKPSIIGETYGEKWIRMYSVENGKTNNVWSLAKSEDYTGTSPYALPVNIADEGQLWCFVGTSESFKIYNKLAGPDFALDSRNPSLRKFITLSQAEEAGGWCLISQLSSEYNTPGFAICPAGGEGNLGINNNLGTGATGQLLYWHTGSSNDGTRWNVDAVQVVVNLKTNVTDAGEMSATRSRMAQITTAFNGISSVSYVKYSDEPQKLFPPMTDDITFTVSSACLGYSFTGFNNETGNTISFRPVKGENNVTLNFSCTDKDVHYLFYENDEETPYDVDQGTLVPYRIPALARTFDGALVAVCDLRYSGNDIGAARTFGSKTNRIDIVGRVSLDNGKTWEKRQVLLQGSNTYAYGDPAIVADRESNRILLMTVGGTVGFNASTLSNPIKVQRTYLTMAADGTLTVEASENVTDMFYGKGAYEGKGVFEDVNKMFVTSGRIFQSSIIKVGEYYRIYAALPTEKGTYVIYSDDFGATWARLGTTIPGTLSKNESKVEEVDIPATPGSPAVVLSNRITSGRTFNVFNYSDVETGEGTWGTDTQSATITVSGLYGCNGEILILKALRGTTPVTLALQSVPNNTARKDVSIFYKEITTRSPFRVQYFTTTWKGPYQVTDHYSAYSTMMLQHDGNIGFLFEDRLDNATTFSYDIVYKPLSLETITKNVYHLDPSEIEKLTGIRQDLYVSPDLSGRDSQIFDLQGRRVSEMKRGGIYIQNGRKIIK